MASVQERLAYLRESLAAVGFDDDLIASEFRRFTRDSVPTLHLVGFGMAEPKDTSTAVAVADLVDASSDRRLELLLDAARDLAAPVILAAEENTLRVVATGSAHTVFDLPWADLDRLTSYRTSLGPKPLLQAKRGERQLGLFPVPADALMRARRQQRAALGDVISNLLRELGVARRALSAVDEQREIYRIVGSALCALVLADKSGERGSTEEVLQLAQNRIPSVFAWFGGSGGRQRNLLMYSVEYLGAEVDFRKFDNTVLTRVYEEVLVDPEQRRSLGIHYTPVELAERMLEVLPIEEIDPSNRNVLDPACGSGTLLVAAHNRLSALQPRYWDIQTRHDDLTSRLRGQDRDPLAVELTKLALVLNAIPAGNGWEIRQGDSLQRDDRRYFGGTVQYSPSIIVANPPFELPINAGQRLDVAVKFLDMMVDALSDGGLLSVILPATWLTGTGHTLESRNRLRRQCEIFEVWRLPRDLFHHSRASTIVLFARKEFNRRERRGWALVQRVPKVESLELFYSGSIKGSTRVMSHPFSRSGPVRTGLAVRPPLLPLTEVATPRTGAQPLPGHLAAARAGRVRDDGIRWLPRLTGSRQYCRVPENSLLPTSWPEGFLRRIPDEHIESPKLLLGTQATEEAPWLRVVYDDKGILASKGMIWVVPQVGREPTKKLSRSRIALALMAVFASRLATSWLDEASTGRNIRGTDLRAFPVPSDPAVWVQLAEAGANLVAAAEAGMQSQRDLVELDLLVEHAYGLEPDGPVVQAAKARLEGVGDPALDGKPRYHAEPMDYEISLEEPLECDGFVRDVGHSSVLLWVPGVTRSEGTWAQLPSRMPGHMCRPEATFRVTVGDDDDLVSARYRLHDLEWADPSEVEDRVRSRLMAADRRS